MLSERARRIRRGEDEGFSMIEVVVAMVVFALLASVTLGIILRTTDVASSNAKRVAAANLATKQIETTRSQLAINIPDGTTTRTETVGGTTYTIAQTASYTTQDTTATLCEGSGGALAHKLVRVVVTWPNMGSVRPVRSDTVKALGMGDEGLDEAVGALAVGVKNSTGGPVAGVTVTITPGPVSQTTGPDGCAVFLGLVAAPGGTDYTARVNQPGYVGQQNVQDVSVTQGVTRGNVSVAALAYDTGRQLTVSTNATASYPAVAGIPLGVRSSFTSSGRVLPVCGSGAGCATGVPGTGRFLYPAVYDVWAGNCPTHPRPAGTFVTVDVTPSGASATVPLGQVRVRRTSGAGAVPDGSRVQAVSQAGNGCLAGQTYNLANLSGGESRASLPAGTYTIRVTTAAGAVLVTRPDQVVNASTIREVTV
jgi:prepilin-type N-terminal cleavage/methylation domain-containing protein